MIVRTDTRAPTWEGVPRDLTAFGGGVRIYVAESVYRLYDGADQLLYVGCSNNPAKRLRAHARTSPWWPNVARIVVVEYPARALAEQAERTAIDLEKPLHNLAGAPGSGVPYAGGNWAR